MLLYRECLLYGFLHMLHNVLDIAEFISGNVNVIIGNSNNGNSNNGAWNPIMDGIPSLFFLFVYY